MEVVDAVLEIDVTLSGSTPRSLREAAFALIGSFAEASTTVVESRRGDGRARFLVTTGMLEGDGEFSPHGHVVRLHLRSA